MDAMAKKKKSPGRTLKKESRIAKARHWLPTYEGTKVVRAYRKKFHVDATCAVRELQEIGYEFQPGYVDNLLKSEAGRIASLQRKKSEKRQVEKYSELLEQDDRFYYIAGYTSGGAPYGVTWEEMGLSPWSDEELVLDVLDGSVTFPSEYDDLDYDPDYEFLCYAEYVDMGLLR